MTLTPEQFDQLALKEDLKAFATKEELNAVKNEILTAIDSFAKAVSDVKSEQTANVGAHDRIQEDVQKLDLRVKKLEGVSI